MDDVIGVGKLIEAGTGVINNVVNKIASATGILYSDSDYKIRKEAEKKYIDRIINDDSIDECVKLALVSNHKQVFRQYKNQMDITKIALDNIKETNSNKINEVDDDWISYFYDNAKNISNVNIQLVWGKLLSNEINNPNSIPKSLIYTLTVISNDCAKKFNIMCKFVVNEDFPLIPHGEFTEIFLSYGLNFNDFLDLQRLGLVIYDGVGYAKYTKEESIVFAINNTILEVKANNGRVSIGDVLFTSDGAALYKCINVTVDSKLLEIAESYWNSSIIHTYIKNGESYEEVHKNKKHKVESTV